MVQLYCLQTIMTSSDNNMTNIDLVLCCDIATAQKNYIVGSIGIGMKPPNVHCSGHGPNSDV